MNINPHCDKDSFASAQASLEDDMHNGILPQRSEGGREIAPSYVGLTHYVTGRPHICLCEV